MSLSISSDSFLAVRLFEKEAHPFRENGYDVLPVFAFWALF